MEDVLAPLGLSIALAATTTLALLVIGTPLAWWLARTQATVRPLVEAIVAMPLVLPPTVMGFYLLLLLGPSGAIGRHWFALTGSTLTFSFTGLVIASCVYSLPFVVQPLKNAFEAVDPQQLEAAWSLGATPLDAFFTVASPLARRGFLTAAVMGFAHTLGEFGVVLMVGGNIPGRTRVVSIAIFDHVESLDYAGAHILSLLLIGFALVVLTSLFVINRRRVLF